VYFLFDFDQTKRGKALRGHCAVWEFTVSYCGARKVSRLINWFQIYQEERYMFRTSRLLATKVTIGVTRIPNTDCGGFKKPDLRASREATVRVWKKSVAGELVAPYYNDFLA
jgi:hypothetical protein